METGERIGTIGKRGMAVVMPCICCGMCEGKVLQLREGIEIIRRTEWEAIDYLRWQKKHYR